MDYYFYERQKVCSAKNAIKDYSSFNACSSQSTSLHLVIVNRHCQDKFNYGMWQVGFNAVAVGQLAVRSFLTLKIRGLTPVISILI